MNYPAFEKALTLISSLMNYPAFEKATGTFRAWFGEPSRLQRFDGQPLPPLAVPSLFKVNETSPDKMILCNSLSNQVVAIALFISKQPLSNTSKSAPIFIYFPSFL